MVWNIGIRVRAFAVGVLLGSWLGGTPVRAESACRPNADGGASCEAGLSTSSLDQTISAVGGQRMSQWCWAASIAMIFKVHGYTVAQQRIVAETFGEVVDMPGSAMDILRNLDRVWTDDRGRQFRVSADMMGASPETAVQDLAADQPLIIGTLGHAMVLTAVSYETGPWGQSAITGAVVRDPWPGVGRRALSAEEWVNTDLLVRVRVTPAEREIPNAHTRTPDRHPTLAPPEVSADVDDAAAWLEVLWWLFNE